MPSNNQWWSTEKKCAESEKKSWLNLKKLFFSSFTGHLNSKTKHKQTSYLTLNPAGARQFL
jgi:hypothetical protein